MLCVAGLRAFSLTMGKMTKRENTTTEPPQSKTQRNNESDDIFIESSKIELLESGKKLSIGDSHANLIDGLPFLIP